MRISLIDVSGKAEYYKAYARMYEDYVYDLQKKDSRVEDFSLVEFYQFFHDKRFKHYMLTLVNMPMGFIIIEEKAGGQHICETYIEPEYRSRGYGHRMLNKVFEKYPSGFWELEILCQNPRALGFWNDIFKGRDAELYLDEEGFIFKEVYK